MANPSSLVPIVTRAAVAASPRVTAVGASAPRLVGASVIDPAKLRGAAERVTKLSSAEKQTLIARLGNKKVILGGTAIGGAALVGFSADELMEHLNAANPEETLDFIETIDGVNREAGDAVASVYNDKINMSQLDQDFSNARSDDPFLSQAEKTGLGINREQIEVHQTIAREYANVRKLMSFKTLLSLQFLLDHARPEELTTLEDMYNNRV